MTIHASRYRKCFNHFRLHRDDVIEWMIDILSHELILMSFFLRTCGKKVTSQKQLKMGGGACCLKKRTKFQFMQKLWSQTSREQLKSRLINWRQKMGIKSGTVRIFRFLSLKQLWGHARGIKVFGCVFLVFENALEVPYKPAWKIRIL